MVRFLFLISLIFSQFVLAKAEPFWEVGILFLSGEFSSEDQIEIDKNILEIPWIGESYENISLTILREFTDRVVVYRPDVNSRKKTSWDSLFFKKPNSEVVVPGDFLIKPRQSTDKSILNDPQSAKNLLEEIFVKPNSRRLLIVYGHGKGPSGLDNIVMSDLKLALEQTPKRQGLKPLDILWFDSCFMGNLEAAYELRSITQFYVGSQEAEFIDGSPFNLLADLIKSEQPELALRALVSGFIESYSNLKSGTQSLKYIDKSATIAAIETDRLESAIKPLSLINSEIQSSDFKNKLKMNSISMESEELIDLQSLLIRIKKSKTNSPQLRYLWGQFEVSGRVRVVNTPKVKIQPPLENLNLVYGYNGWSRGFVGDNELLSIVPKNLTSGNFVNGPEGKSWPTRSIRKRIFSSVFVPGVSEFDYYFVNAAGEQVGDTHIVFQANDYEVFLRRNPSDPVLIMGRTISTRASRYMGISIQNPFIKPSSLEYYKTEFFQKTSWGLQN